MMACDVMVRLVREVYEVADRISEVEKVLDGYEKRKLAYV